MSADFLVLSQLQMAQRADVDCRQLMHMGSGTNFVFRKVDFRAQGST